MVWFTVTQAKTTLVEHIPTTINEDPTGTLYWWVDWFGTRYVQYLAGLHVILRDCICVTVTHLVPGTGTIFGIFCRARVCDAVYSLIFERCTGINSIGECITIYVYWQGYHTHLLSHLLVSLSKP
jgi:hypothetical protein